MQLSYGQLEMTIAQHLRIQPDRIPTLKSRIKQLQRLEFPPGVNVGRGAKMTYTGEHLFQMVTVFELLNFGLPAKTACELTTRHWEEFAGGYALSVLQGRRPTAHENVEDVFAVLHIHSMHEIQFSQHGHLVEPSGLRIYDLTALQGEFRDYDFKSEYARWILSQSAIQRRVMEIAAKLAGVSSANLFDEEFHGWLPDGAHPEYSFHTYYPDRSNIEMREHLNSYHGNDSAILTDEGKEEAVQFVNRDFCWESIF